METSENNLIKGKNIYFDKNNIEVNNLTFQKMLFLYNAVNDGWSVKKYENSYIFTKKHEGKTEILLDSYLQEFIASNLNLNVNNNFQKKQ
jgi:hypothetical protein